MITRRWLYVVLLAYAAGFLLHPPRVLLVVDESNYVSQAMAFAAGRLNLPGADPLVPANPLPAASTYPPGTSLLQAPFVALVGWRGAALLSAMALVVATLVSARWIREHANAEGFAILIPAFAGALLFGRLAMSDMPSAATVAVALWLLFRSERNRRVAFAAGAAAGAGLLFRETNGIIVAPFVAGAILRRERHSAWLLAGGAAAIGLRFALHAGLFGDPLFVRASGYGFSVSSVTHNAPTYALLLMVAFPFAAALPFVYRGPRRAETVTACGAYIALFLAYDYGGVTEAGRVRGLLLASRYLLPLLPLLSFMAAESWPRWWARLTRRPPAWAIQLAGAGVIAAAALVHPLVRRMEAGPVAVVEALAPHRSAGRPLVTNHLVTLKYLSVAYGPRQLILSDYVRGGDVPPLVRAHGPLRMAFLDRRDSEFFSHDADRTMTFLLEVARHCATTRLEERQVAGLRLHAYEVSACR